MAPKTSEGHFLSRILGSLAGGAVYMGTQGWSWTDSIFFCVLFSALALVVGYFESRSGQVERDQEAGHLERVKSREFVLYLRPFNITNALPVPNPAYVAGSAVTSAGYEPRTLDFETLLQSASPRGRPIIGLGRVGEAVGVGRVSVNEDEWQKSFVDLSGRARAVLIVPGDRPGILWELQSLKARQQLSKCLFVLPGVLGEHPEWRWDDTTSLLTSAMPSPPEKLNDVTTFRINSDGRICDLRSASSDVVAHVGTRLEAIIEGEPKEALNGTPIPKADAASIPQHGWKRRPVFIGATAVVVVALGWLLLRPRSLMSGTSGPASVNAGSEAAAESRLNDLLTEIRRPSVMEIELSGCKLTIHAPAGFGAASGRERELLEGFAEEGTSTAIVLIKNVDMIERLGLQVRSVDGARGRARLRRQIRSASLCSDLQMTKVYSADSFIVCQLDDGALGMHRAIAAFETGDTPLLVDGAGLSRRAEDIQKAMAALMTTIAEAAKSCAAPRE